MLAISHDPRVKIVEDGTPAGHFLTACEYRAAVLTLREAYPHENAAGVWRPISNLIGMCAELSMKAFLLQSGVGDRELKYDFGHGLDKLLAECLAKGLDISDPHKDTIERLSLTIATHFFRYGRSPGDSRLPWPVPTVNIDKAIAAIDVLVDAAARKTGHSPLLPDVRI